MLWYTRELIPIIVTPGKTITNEIMTAATNGTANGTNGSFGGSTAPVVAKARRKVLIIGAGAF